MVSEEGSEQDVFSEAFDFYKVTTFFASLDFVINELEARFSENDLSILRALTDVVMNPKPAENSFVGVSIRYGINIKLLKVDNSLFVSFRNSCVNVQLETPTDILSHV